MPPEGFRFKMSAFVQCQAFLWAGHLQVCVRWCDDESRTSIIQKDMPLLPPKITIYRLEPYTPPHTPLTSVHFLGGPHPSARHHSAWSCHEEVCPGRTHRCSPCVTLAHSFPVVGVEKKECAWIGPLVFYQIRLGQDPVLKLPCGLRALCAVGISAVNATGCKGVTW